MTKAVRYNDGHSLDAFATRVRMLSQHPELWRQVPAGVTPLQWLVDPALRQLWLEVAAFLLSCGLLSVHTAPRDVNVPKLVDAVRRLHAPRPCAFCGDGWKCAKHANEGEPRG